MTSNRPERPLSIRRRSNSFFRDKGDGTSVHYYVFPEYEIHYNEIDPGTVQQWHHHELIEEALYITGGRIDVHWRDEHGTHVDSATEGDVVCVGSAPHTLVNASGEKVTFLVFRCVPDGIDKRDLIRSDKVLDEPDALQRG